MIYKKNLDKKTSLPDLFVLYYRQVSLIADKRKICWIEPVYCIPNTPQKKDIDDTDFIDKHVFFL